MVQHLFPTFLESREEYAQAVQHWVDLWNQMNVRERDSWRHPWMGNDWENHDVFMDGNPIFTAHTPVFQKGTRIIQYPPTCSHIEFNCWLDTFGGPLTDPDAIQELVISCALSEEASLLAFQLMEAWIVGGVTFRREEPLGIGYPVIAPSTSEPERLLVAA
jgi:hypothetical protein